MVKQFLVQIFLTNCLTPLDNHSVLNKAIKCFAKTLGQEISSNSCGFPKSQAVGCLNVDEKIFIYFNVYNRTQCLYIQVIYLAEDSGKLVIDPTGLRQALQAKGILMTSQTNNI